MADAITASEARQRFFPLIKQVNEDHEPIEIVAKGGNAILLSKADYDAMQEALYLFSTPANARRLLESIEQARLGNIAEHDLIRE
jgi:antitoxin YefM